MQLNLWQAFVSYFSTRPLQAGGTLCPNTNQLLSGCIQLSYGTDSFIFTTQRPYRALGCVIALPSQYILNKSIQLKKPFKSQWIIPHITNEMKYYIGSPPDDLYFDINVHPTALHYDIQLTAIPKTTLDPIFKNCQQANVRPVAIESTDIALKRFETFTTAFAEAVCLDLPQAICLGAALKGTPYDATSSE